MLALNAANIECLPPAAARVILSKVEMCSEDQVSHCTGTALFLLQSCLNHSCKPNAEVVGGLIDSSKALIKLVALKNIKQGEEITISYIDHPNKKSQDERQKELTSCYLFCCECSKCRQERTN